VHSTDIKAGTLYLVSTPIGNLKDITFRAVEVLKSVGLIAAEDTRHSRKLLNHYGIQNRLVSYHDHNKDKSAPGLIKKLADGVDVALISDAGSPGISDPGYFLVNLARKSGITVTACPGPCAAIMALSISGLPTDSFSFYGFLPAKPGKRKNFIKTLANENKSMVLYESSGRIEKLLKDLYEILGDRLVLVSRELTKKFEESGRGRLSEFIEDNRFSNSKGEFTLVISKKDKADKVSLDDIKDKILRRIESGGAVKDISKEIADMYGIPKKEVYSFIINNK